MMCRIGRKRSFPKYLIFIIIINLMIPGVLYGSELNKNEEEKKAQDAKYELAIRDNLISLSAEDASLKKILEDIGQKMNIEIFAHIPTEDKITTRFADLPLEEALKKFETSYAYITDSKEKQGNITQIVVVPSGQNAQLNLKEVKKVEPKDKRDIADKKTSKPEPFKFEFDPSKVMEKEK